ncbi:MAG: 2-amino-4-hydroxy-6-hydroxymethyldihydropteridine diphosphokinase [Alphaproteobacteria bacterium]|jgi:2-amino-4-hydroxy-6-hydroxymethyldihydropteridine diphosphokinase|nr:2-amino-4-hydroxy-6-hydroxymethyldihydropteridine diphosphokinase [Alphaproteobacteria bacterium]MDP6563490.1 2-amino-4-hydroxy-6-hydroxymethyldihydropteridine diphosphokinase [Alphaproteobacteria bacterium]MDP6812676.1 2-amino-4-hydroxy-6-hydroxymethyldihydropteridine diphosphokinase [Alphaproteobacteria bacterium]
MILIGLGGNLASNEFGPPRRVLEAALAELARAGVAVRRRSPWYRSAPVPPSGQPWFVNGVAAVDTSLPPAPLLALLHRIEARLGRTRRDRWEARIADLDLLAHGDHVIGWPAPGSAGEGGLVLPHPRLHQRAFVLAPLADIAPDWRHPVLGTSAGALLAGLTDGQVVELLAENPDDAGSASLS